MYKLLFLCVVSFVLKCDFPQVEKSTDWERFFSAIQEVETGGHPDPSKAVGDGGKSLGPYQIGHAYWTDSRMEGDYNQVSSIVYSRQVMMAYWRRYVPKAVESKNWEILARVHNGGPKGHLKKATVAYWKKVSKILQGGSSHDGQN